jgi:hypothetical protein
MQPATAGSGCFPRLTEPHRSLGAELSAHAACLGRKLRRLQVFLDEARAFVETSSTKYARIR